MHLYYVTGNLNKIDLVNNTDSDHILNREYSSDASAKYTELL